MSWEVRTMRSGTSFFDWTVFKKTVCRFWPLWGAYFAVWLVMLPLNGLMFLQMDQHNTGYMEDFAFHMVPEAAPELALQLTLVFGVLAAMAVFSHLYNPRSANFFGGLPVRREGLFLTHYLAGLAFLVVPNLVIFLLTLLVELAGGVVCWQGLGFWLAAACGEGFFFYSLAVFCAMFTGHLLALPAFYAVINFLVIGVTELLSVVFRAFYHGFSGFADGVHEVVKWFTPVVRLEERVRALWHWVDEAAQVSGGERVLELHGLGTVGVYAIAALLLTVGAFFLYRARRLESAGDVVSVKAMRPVFQYGVAFCAGLAFGMVTTMFTGGGEIMLMTAILVWGVIGYFAARMLLDKSFRVFGRWKGGLAVAAVFAALFCVVGFDLTGFETRIPDPAKVDRVMLYGLYAVHLGDSGDGFQQELDDPELLQLVNVLHQEAVAQRDEERQAQAQLGGVSTQLNLDYRLKGGGTLSRRYTLWLDPDEMDQEGTAAWAVQQFYDNRELYWGVYGFARLEEALAGGLRLDRVELNHYDETTGEENGGVLYGGDARTVLEAVKEDFFAGRIGVRRVDDEERWHGGSAESSLVFYSSDAPEGGYYTVQIALQDTASSTLSALAELEDRIERGGQGAWEDGFPATEAG